MNATGRKVRKFISLKHQEEINFTKKLRVTKKCPLFKIFFNEIRYNYKATDYNKKEIIIKSRSEKEIRFFALQCKTALISIYSNERNTRLT